MKFINEKSSNRSNLIEVTDYSKTISKLSFNYGWGANVLVIDSEDGLLLIDTGYKDLIKELKKLLNDKYGKPVIKIINTHFHGDHVGCNGIIEKKGEILVHKNTEKRKFYINIYSLIEASCEIKFGTELINIIPLPYGHSATDMLVFLKKSNIMHTGDLYLAKSFPLLSGGEENSVYHTIDNLKKLYELIDSQTIVVSGHGDDTNKKELLCYIEMVETSIRKVENLISKGYSKTQIKNKDALTNYSNYSGTINFITSSSWIDNIWRSYHNKKSSEP